MTASDTLVVLALLVMDAILLKLRRVEGGTLRSRVAVSEGEIGRGPVF
jgi:hypothetical protein